MSFSYDKNRIKLKNTNEEIKKLAYARQHIDNRPEIKLYQSSQSPPKHHIKIDLVNKTSDKF